MTTGGSTTGGWPGGVNVDEELEITRDGPTGEITRWVDWMV